MPARNRLKKVLSCFINDMNQRNLLKKVDDLSKKESKTVIDMIWQKLNNNYT